MASGYGASGMFGSFINVTTNGTAQWYNVEGTGGAAGGDFGGTDLGTFDVGNGDTMTISGGEALTFKNGLSDVFNAKLNYSIQAVGGGTFFTELDLSFTANSSFTSAANGSNYTNGGDQQWSDSFSIDALSGLANGDYEIVIFTKASSSDGDHFHNNGGTNYNATFTVVPEPSSSALMGLGGLALILRRRR
ncbi:MAG: PEP-CTERM sorting domain-containing protein [Akkermansiaceae bacterium]